MYTNLPPSTYQSSEVIVNAYDSLSTGQVSINPGVFDAATAILTSKGFDTTAAQSLASLFITQGLKDNVNPLQIIDTLSGISQLEISALVAELINYTRYKTSFLGQGVIYNSNQNVARNILP